MPLELDRNVGDNSISAPVLPASALWPAINPTLENGLVLMGRKRRAFVGLNQCAFTPRNIPAEF